METSPSLIPFHPAHYLMITPRPEEAHLFGIDRLKQGRDLASAGPAYTAIDEQGPWAAGGIALLHPGVGEAWLVASERVTNHTRWFMRTTAWQLEYEATRLALHRVQLIVYASHLQAHRFAQALGFEFESKMLRYAPTGVDCVMYRRLFDV